MNSWQNTFGPVRPTSTHDQCNIRSCKKSWWLLVLVMLGSSNMEIETSRWIRQETLTIETQLEMRKFSTQKQYDSTCACQIIEVYLFLLASIFCLPRTLIIYFLSPTLSFSPGVSAFPVGCSLAVTPWVRARCVLARHSSPCTSYRRL